MDSPGRSPVTIDLSTPGSEKTLKDKPFKIKEGAKFTMSATFRVQHEILSGLHYVQVVKRKGVRVSKDSEMIVSLWGGGTAPEPRARDEIDTDAFQGSYAPCTDKQPVYTKKCRSLMPTLCIDPFRSLG
jgi:Rho GDP-dissociation inhibitor